MRGTMVVLIRCRSMFCLPEVATCLGWYKGLSIWFGSSTKWLSTSFKVGNFMSWSVCINCQWLPYISESVLFDVQVASCWYADRAEPLQCWIDDDSETSSKLILVTAFNSGERDKYCRFVLSWHRGPEWGALSQLLLVWFTWKFTHRKFTLSTNLQ